ncbi:OmpA family protein [Mangrovibacterium marinum]|uniref:OmpA family protein n=1 Tax=Mangrovibacterium marinum TaxID=1639118 RepID=UPI002A189545|nr:OmpA family protein [Mangrovibacterium marinum]
MPNNACTVVLLLTLLFSLFSPPARGQEKKLQRAEACYQNMDFPEALRLYRHLYERDRRRVELLSRMGELAYRLGENKEALRYYKLLVMRKKASANDLLTYAFTLRRLGDFEGSEHWLAEYNKLKADSLGDQLTEQLELVRRLQVDRGLVRMEPLKVNTYRSEFGPVVYGDSLIFCSDGRRSGPRRRSWLNDSHQPFLKLFVAPREADGQLGKPVPFATGLRSKYHDGPLSYAPNSGCMLVTQNYKPRMIRLDFRSFVQMKLVEARHEGGGWKVLDDFVYANPKYSVAHPALNADGTILLFASNKPGGYGFSDLYICYRRDSSWQEPQNLGPALNTEGYELFPYLANDSTLYFASTGHLGLGGLDLFQARLDSTGVHSIRNLGAPFNSSGDDFSLALLDDGRSGYLASDRNRSKRDELFYFEKPGQLMPVRVLVRDEDNGQPLSRAALAVLNAQGDTVAAGTTDASGLLSMDLLTGEDYRIQANKANYREGEQAICARGLADEPAQDIALSLHAQPASANDAEFATALAAEKEAVSSQPAVFVIHYPLSKWLIEDSERETLEEALALVKAHPGSKIRIASYADSRGSRSFNQRLSDKRAELVKNYFISRYIRPERISSKGYGESQLLNRCADGVSCPESEHALNRRTVITVE